ncbi:MAG: hypothetical protein WDZ69_01340 [Candidatus Pacearchaeota archaeon]
MLTDRLLRKLIELPKTDPNFERSLPEEVALEMLKIKADKYTQDIINKRSREAIGRGPDSPLTFYRDTMFVKKISLNKRKTLKTDFNPKEVRKYLGPEEVPNEILKRNVKYYSNNLETIKESEDLKRLFLSWEIYYILFKDRVS